LDVPTPDADLERSKQVNHLHQLELELRNQKQLTPAYSEGRPINNLSANLQNISLVFNFNCLITRFLK